MPTVLVPVRDCMFAKLIKIAILTPFKNAVDVGSLEEILRKYGIRATDNIQGTSSGGVVDFGHYYVSHTEVDIPDPKKVPPIEPLAY